MSFPKLDDPHLLATAGCFCQRTQEDVGQKMDDGMSWEAKIVREASDYFICEGD